MCVFVREKEREKKRECVCVPVCVYVYVCVYMCVYLRVCVCAFECACLHMNTFPTPDGPWMKRMCPWSTDKIRFCNNTRIAEPNRKFQRLSGRRNEYGVFEYVRAFFIWQKNFKNMFSHMIHGIQRFINTSRCTTS